MKWQSKKYFWFIVVPFIISLLSVFSFPVYAEDIVQYTFPSQTSSSQGSNGSFISTDSALKYINKGNNSSVIQNYFTGQYYDSIAWTFTMNWSSDATQNVRIIDSTSLCGQNAYGYKLGWFAYSETVGYIDFDYNSSIFVYYCSNDQQLHGYAYSRQVWYQNFNGISFTIASSPTTIAEIPTSSSQTWSQQFTNSNTNIWENIDDIITENNNQIQEGDNYEFVAPWSSSYYNLNSPTPIIAPTINLGGIKFEFIPEEETIFYIIK